MVHDISQIRKQTPSSPSLTGKPTIRQEKTIPLLRAKELQKDEETQFIVEKAQTGKKLIELVKKKRVELETVANNTKQLLENAGQEADRVVTQAKTRALELITQARFDRDAAKKLLVRHETIKKELSKLLEEVTVRENLVKETEKDVDIQKKSVDKKENELKTKLERVSGHEKQIVDTLGICLSLLELSSEQVSLLQNLNSRINIDLSEILSKADIIVNRTKNQLKNIDLKKSLLQTKAIELQQKEDWLIDREQMLHRTAKEIEIKSKKLKI